MSTAHWVKRQQWASNESASDPSACTTPHPHVNWDSPTPYRVGKDYQRTVLQPGRSILILAPHSGGIERGTGELARVIAGHDCTLYDLAGVRAKNNWALHTPSADINDPILEQLIPTSLFAVAIHGHAIPGLGMAIGLGGRNRALRALLSRRLVRAGFQVATLGSHLRAKSRYNVVNRPVYGGVQLELGHDLRRLLHKWPSDLTPTLLDHLARTIRVVLWEHLAVLETLHLGTVPPYDTAWDGWAVDLPRACPWPRSPPNWRDP